MKTLKIVAKGGVPCRCSMTVSYTHLDVYKRQPLLNTESNIFLKTENLQVTGSFKVRGAYYKISQLSEEEKSKGVIASSAGNHAQGVALAAQENKIPCTICMPDGEMCIRDRF